jgi:hypothetical protein
MMLRVSIQSDPQKAQILAQLLEAKAFTKVGSFISAGLGCHLSLYTYYLESYFLFVYCILTAPYLGWVWAAYQRFIPPSAVTSNL